MQKSGSFDFPIQKTVLKRGKTPLLVLLVTPSLSKLLEEGQDWLPHVLSQAYHKPYVGQEFDVLAAVVDRVSRPYARINLGGDGDGPEGLSMCAMDSEVAARDLWSPRDDTKAQERMSIEQRSTLSFVFEPHRLKMSFSPERGFVQRPFISRSLQLPLANTLFHNGKSSTMIAQRWVITGTLNSRPEFLRTRKTLLSEQTLQMDGIVKYAGIAGDDPRFQLTSALEPITVPYYVDKGVGNILRALRTGGDGSRIVPASEELEKAIQLYFELRNIPTQRIDIWALITPSENWTGRPQVRAAKIESAIEAGSRIHKVLSGGGGWGTKQGLLSLDPNCDYGHEYGNPKQSYGDGEDLEAEKREALGEVVRPGDVVEFLTCKRSLTKTAEKTKTLNGFKLETQGRLSIEFGTLSSAIDSMPVPDSSRADNAEPPGYLHAANHFGAHSTEGMSLKIEVANFDGTGYVGAQQLGIVSQTKLDAPGTRFGFTRREKLKVSGKERQGQPAGQSLSQDTRNSPKVSRQEVAVEIALGSVRQDP